MRLHHIALLLLSGAALNSTLAFATDSSQSIAKTNDNPAATLSYWTPERLRDAKPMSLPLVNPNKVRFMPAEEITKQKSVSVEGAPPQIELKLDSTPLFDPVKQLSEVDAPTLQDRGTQGLNFSSSRLVPLTADTTYPYSAVGKLFFSKPGGGNYVCSASVIANRIVVTAGHCVHSGTSAGYYTNFLFIPAFRDGAAPLQKWTWSYVQTTPAWIAGGGTVANAADFAVLEMQDLTLSGVVRTIGSVTGKLGYATNKLANNHIHMLGYPCNLDSCSKMHQVAAQNGPAVAPNNVTYGTDAGGGSSGGPWVQNFGVAATGQTGGLNPGRNQVIAVTSWGYTDPALKVQGASNFDTAFTTLYNQVCSHKVGNC